MLIRNTLLFVEDDVGLRLRNKVDDYYSFIREFDVHILLVVSILQMSDY